MVPGHLVSLGFASSGDFALLRHLLRMLWQQVLPFALGGTTFGGGGTTFALLEAPGEAGSVLLETAVLGFNSFRSTAPKAGSGGFYTSLLRKYAMITS